MYQDTSKRDNNIPLNLTLEVAARRTIAQQTAQRRPEILAALDRAESALANARKLAHAIA